MTDDVDGDLIARTLENAASAPFYARVWGDRWRGIRSVAALSSLPLLDKATAIANQQDLIVGISPAGFGIASSGTTRHADLPALNVLRSERENSLLHGDGNDADAAHHSEDADNPYPGWTLVVVGVHHGLPARPPARGEIRVPWMYHRNALSMIEACISRPQPDGRRVTAMRISTGALKTVTVWLLEQGRDVRSYGVKLIGTNGSRLSAHWRDLVSTVWGADIYDNFSLSEIPTPAVECKACDALHFAWPPLLYEVLDLDTGAPIDDAVLLRHGGTGRLVLTPLTPWVQTMPLIRYDTGDVVSVGGVCHAFGQPRITYLGRARRGVVVATPGGAAFVLAPVFVQDVLEALPETERNPHPAVSSGLLHSRELGLPRFVVEKATVEQDGVVVVVRLRFEVRFDPRLYVTATARLEAEVRSRLLGLDRSLARLVERAVVRFEVVAHAPGSLHPPGDKFE